MTDTSDPDIFEDVSSDTDADAFDDDVVILSSRNKDELLAPGSKRFLFPAEEGQSRAGFYVRHASLARVSRYQQAHQAGSTKQQLKAACELLADSVVDGSGEKVWTTNEIQSMAHGRIDRFLFIQKCVSAFNGMSDSSATMQDLIEDAGKN